HVGNAAEMVKIAHWIVLQIVVERGVSGLRNVVDRDGVAVGCRLGDAGHADGAPGASDILHNHALAERLAHGFADQSLGPPAAAGTTSVIDLAGQAACAIACGATAAAKAKAVAASACLIEVVIEAIAAAPSHWFLLRRFPTHLHSLCRATAGHNCRPIIQI